jgi:hypothetical protein
MMDDTARWMQHMRRGKFGAAWRVSDAALRRFDGVTRGDLPRHLQSVWSGAPLDGKRVLVRCYHGLGDTIQFIRYMPLLRERAAQVTVWAQPILVPLLLTADGIDRVMPLHDGTPECKYDVDVEVMELPYVFRTTLETLPAAVPYFQVDAVSLGDSDLKIGIVWRGGEWDARRDVPFSLITQLAGVAGVTFYVLQQYPHDSERHSRFMRILPTDADGLATARIMRALDLIISIDSMPAHLAGALALPTWTLLQKDADWRWMDDRESSPWYPTMRLFRQRRSGNWEPVIARVKLELAKLVEKRNS